MTSVTQSAAINSTDEVLGAAGNYHDHLEQGQSTNEGTHDDHPRFPHDQYRHSRSYSNENLRTISMMPPPFRPPERNELPSFDSVEFST